MSGISTHILDVSLGRPAAGVRVELSRRDGEAWTALAVQHTDADGRCRELLPAASVAPGDYRLVFDTGPYHVAQNVAAPLYPEVTLTFTVNAAGGSYHMPLLLSPGGYTTYRGS